MMVLLADRPLIARPGDLPHSHGPPHFGGALGTPRGTAQPEAVVRLGVGPTRSCVGKSQSSMFEMSD